MDKRVGEQAVFVWAKFKQEHFLSGGSKTVRNWKVSRWTPEGLVREEGRMSGSIVRSV